MFTINIKRKALRKLAKLDQKQKHRIQTTILILKNDPIPFKKTDICKLRGYENIYRIRVGNLRIVYEILWNQKTILIHYIGPREKAYQ
jgi:mRNA interferase RelE/StbE